MRSGSPRHSVLISTRNRARHLSQVLAQLERLCPPAEVEIVVFDDASTDDTPDVCARFASRIQSTRAAENVGYIEGRRRLIDLSRGEYIVVLDDDSCLLDRDALHRIEAVFDHFPSAGVLAANIASPGFRGGLLPTDARPIETADFIGCGHVLRRSAVERTGSYAPFLAGYGAEETYLSLRMLDAGFSIMLVPGLRVYHAEDPSQYQSTARRAGKLVNELGTVLNAYPLALVLPGGLLKFAAHARYNLRHGSSRALALALQMLPRVTARALCDRHPIQLQTLRRYRSLRASFEKQRQACVAGGTVLSAWPETFKLFGPA